MENRFHKMENVFYELEEMFHHPADGMSETTFLALKNIFGRMEEMFQNSETMFLELEKMYKAGKFIPIRTEEVMKLLAEFKPQVPEYVRIMRIQRDIPTKQTIDGVDKTNLRQLLKEYMNKRNIHCNCIRCNEIKSPITHPELQVLEYTASQGKEFFISLQQGKEIIGFCRLRFPSQCLRKEITADAAIIRELHVYGNAMDLEQSGDVQHRGFGKMLLKKAEDICKENKKDKLLVISGIGVREYYRKQGYQQDGPYVSKNLN